jgi:hypothetical protein
LQTLLSKDGPSLAVVWLLTQMREHHDAVCGRIVGISESERLSLTAVLSVVTLSVLELYLASSSISSSKYQLCPRGHTSTHHSLAQFDLFGRGSL